MAKRIPRCFELSSWLKINLAESMLVGVGCADEDIQPLARKLPFKVGTLLTLGDNPMPKTFWDSNNEFFSEESLWKRNFLGKLLTLGYNPRSKTFWDSNNENF